MKRHRSVPVRSSAACIAVSLGTQLCPATPAIGAPIEWPTASGGNGHFYDAVRVPSGISWANAEAAARQLNFNGFAGHLVTITSAAENAFVFSNLASSPALWNGQGPWLGGFRDPNDPLYGSDPAAGWRWVTGEAWSFTNWAPGEPNQGFPIPTDYAQFFIDTLTGIGPASYWNDTFNVNPNPGQPVLGFIVEYPVPAPGSAVLLVASAMIASSRRNRRQVALKSLPVPLKSRGLRRDFGALATAEVTPRSGKPASL